MCCTFFFRAGIVAIVGVAGTGRFGMCNLGGGLTASQSVANVNAGVSRKEKC
jgi:hypothetical protein